MSYVYHPQILEALASHGVRPTEQTPPALAHEFVSDLYRFELRQLKKQQVAGEIPKERYASHVIDLRRRYLVISVPVARWTVG